MSRERRSILPRRLSPRKLVSLGPKGLAVFLALLLLGVTIEYWEKRTGDFLEGTVATVVDGDTLVVDVSGDHRRVRLIGVDTPETVHPRKPVQYYGREASNFTKRSLLGRRVWLEYDVAPLDRYRRHLAYVWLEEPGRSEEAVRRGMFNARLLLEGYGRLLTVQPNVRHADLFTVFQTEARTAGRGLWGRKR